MIVLCGLEVLGFGRGFNGEIPQGAATPPPQSQDRNSQNSKQALNVYKRLIFNRFVRNLI